MKDILITLCARGGSKGIPGKNIKLLNGRPLIDYSIKFAKTLGSEFNIHVELSTDDLEIKNISNACGLNSDYLRPAFLSTDSAGKVDAIKDLLQFAENKHNKKFDYVLDLDITSPLRTIEDIQNAFSIIEEDPEALTLFSVSAAHKNPYFNMVEQNKEGYFELSKKRDETTLSRQSAPKVYELNASFYFYRREFFDLELNGVITDHSLIYPMDHICFDLDHLIDFEFMDYLLKNGKISFLKF